MSNPITQILGTEKVSRERFNQIISESNTAFNNIERKIPTITGISLNTVLTPGVYLFKDCILEVESVSQTVSGMLYVVMYGPSDIYQAIQVLSNGYFTRIYSGSEWTSLTFHPYTLQSDLAVVATSGSYNDLVGKPQDNTFVYTLTHTKSGNVHKLTGLSGVSGIVSCQFKATAGYNAALDTLTVDGVSYTIKLSNGEKAEDNLFVSGAVVPFIVDTAGKTVNFKAGGGGYKKGDVIAAENVQVKYAATTDFSDTTKISDVSVAVDDLVVDPLNRYIYLLGSSKANIYSTAGNLIATVSGSFSSSYKYRYFFDETGNLYWCNGTDYYKVTPSGTRSLFFSLSNSTNVGAWYNDRAYFISGSTFYHVNADGGIISQYTLSSSISGDFIGVDDAGSIYLYVYSTPFYYFKKFSSTGSQVWSNTSTDDVFYSKRMVCIGGYMYYSNDHYLKRMSLSGTYDSNTFGYIGSGYCVLKTFLIGNTTYVASVDSGKYIKVFDLDQKAVVYTLPTTYYTADCSELGEIYGSISSPGMLIKQHQKPIGYEVKEVAK